MTDVEKEESYNRLREFATRMTRMRHAEPCVCHLCALAESAYHALGQEPPPRFYFNAFEDEDGNMIG